jgi:serine/threonine-protein kinase
MLLNDRYLVKEKLAQGGFGTTYLAEDTQLPSRRICVVKQLTPKVDNPQIQELIRERFQREAAILESLNNLTDRIPSLYAYFQRDGGYYLVQEYIEGETLQSLVNRAGVLSENRVDRILTDLLTTLQAIHQRRIVHRDIKPDNIIIRTKDGLPVLIDFGAIKEVIGNTTTEIDRLTPSIAIGTPGYMSSEQAAGRPIYNSDLYSLGLMAIYLLSGIHPTELPMDNEAEFRLPQFVPPISDRLQQVLIRSIRYHPRDRFTDAKTMLNAINGTHVVSSQNTQNIPQDITYLPNPTPPRRSYPQKSPSSPWLKPLAGISITAIVAFSFNFFNRGNIPTANSPENSIQLYYQKLRDRDYSSAWQLLPLALQSNRQVHPKGYQSFREWWSQHSNITLDRMQVVDLKERSAIVDIKQSSDLDSGTHFVISLRVILNKDRDNKWQIVQLKYLK